MEANGVTYELTWGEAVLLAGVSEDFAGIDEEDVAHLAKDYMDGDTRAFLEDYAYLKEYYEGAEAGARGEGEDYWPPRNCCPRCGESLYVDFEPSGGYDCALSVIRRATGVGSTPTT